MEGPNIYVHIYSVPTTFSHARVLRTMAESSKSATSRIAIKFGTTSSTNGKKNSRTDPPSALGKRPRSLALNPDSDSEDDDPKPSGRHEVITGFSDKGAETRGDREDSRRRPAAPLVIEKQKNSWQSAMAARRQKGSLPAEAAAQPSGGSKDVELADQDKPIQWGLTLTKKPTEGDTEEGARDVGEASKTQVMEAGSKGQQEIEPAKTRTVDDEAMDALLGRTKAPEKIIETLTEDEVYRRDAANAPTDSTLQDYENMPVEEFGAALLRGMGWNGDPKGPKVKKVVRRANRLGLGAKELKDAEDLGAWNNKGPKKSRPRLDEYRRNEENRKEERDRNRDSYRRDKERERDGFRDRDRDRDRERDHHRSRHRDSERRSDRR
jgi:hypothetical protein